MAARAIQLRYENEWNGGTKKEYLEGFRIVRRLGDVQYYQREGAAEPRELEAILKRYAIQLGGNAFVKFFWDREGYTDAKTVVRNYGPNGGPHYGTDYEKHKWYVGYATGVIVEPCTKK